MSVQVVGSAGGVHGAGSEQAVTGCSVTTVGPSAAPSTPAPASLPPPGFVSEPHAAAASAATHENDTNTGKPGQFREARVMRGLYHGVRARHRPGSIRPASPDRVLVAE